MSDSRPRASRESALLFAQEGEKVGKRVPVREKLDGPQGLTEQGIERYLGLREEGLGRGDKTLGLMEEAGHKPPEPEGERSGEEERTLEEQILIPWNFSLARSQLPHLGPNPISGLGQVPGTLGPSRKGPMTKGCLTGQGVKGSEEVVSAGKGHSSPGAGARKNKNEVPDGDILKVRETPIDLGGSI